MNAHGNNFVLLKEGGGSSLSIQHSSHPPQAAAFLAPLDFDMSYTKENCCFGKIFLLYGVCINFYVFKYSYLFLYLIINDD